MTHGSGKLSEKGSGNYQIAEFFLWRFTKLKYIYDIYIVCVFTEIIALDTYSKSVWGDPYAYVGWG